MPFYRTEALDKDGKMVYSDICYPVTKEFREKINETILEIYQKEKQKAVEHGQRKTEMKNSKEYRVIKDTPFR